MSKIDYQKALERAQRNALQPGAGRSGPRHLTGPPTPRQLALLTKLGVEETPDDQTMASRWIKTAIQSKANPTQ